jgi:NAD(P)-dependent dehydrogenase (short-subunit alcohol dehydrogenase family)
MKMSRPDAYVSVRNGGNVGWTEDQLPDLSGRTAIVTGANSGIGLCTVVALADHGARVVLACRDVEAGRRALRRVGSGSGSCEVRELDLASMASVRGFAEAWDEPLHLLINNAGVMAPPKRVETADGYELQFGTNHLGHFVLTGLLLPHLLAAGGARVVTVASTAHHTGDESVLEANADGKYDPQRSYGNSKLANLLFALELHRELTSRGLALSSTAAHPGVAATGLVADPQGMGANRAIRAVAPLFLKIFTQSARAGARATLYAAIVAEPGSYTGPQRFGESRGRLGPANLSAYASDEKLARKLWQVSEELTGFHYPWPA